MVTALEQVGDDVGEALDLIDPRSVRRGEVHVETGVLGQPGGDGRVLVGAVVVADQMHVEVVGNLGVNLGQELL